MADVCDNCRRECLVVTEAVKQAVPSLFGGGDSVFENPYGLPGWLDPVEFWRVLHSHNPGKRLGVHIDQGMLLGVDLLCFDCRMT